MGKAIILVYDTDLNLKFSQTFEKVSLIHVEMFDAVRVASE